MPPSSIRIIEIIPAIIIQMSKFVAARFCEGGHICTLPRECCTQGCCPAYHTNNRQLPPASSDHVLNLFFISHWFFWCVVVAIILAILCAYSLWKRRRTLCGWGFSDHHGQSEGDSAGSCYAPPQYSRCNSFLHPPPPYTEVTSKPDLYPLVYTCNGGAEGNGKIQSGSNYLMVQYFRNYIVRPAGSLSAASTVDSLSSSFICNINEANSLVPPPYSRAASPDIGFGSHLMQHYVMPRSASQVVCQNTNNNNNNNNNNSNNNNNNSSNTNHNNNNNNSISNTNNNNNNNLNNSVNGGGLQLTVLADNNGCNGGVGVGVEVGVGLGVGAVSLNTNQPLPSDCDNTSVRSNKKSSTFGSFYTNNTQEGGAGETHLMMMKMPSSGGQNVSSKTGTILDLHYNGLQSYHQNHQNNQALNEVNVSNNDQLESGQQCSSSNATVVVVGGGGQRTKDTNNNHNGNFNVIKKSTTPIRVSTGFVQSHSDQQFQSIATQSNSSLSDIFVNNSCTAMIGHSGQSGEGGQSGHSVTVSCPYVTDTEMDDLLAGNNNSSFKSMVEEESMAKSNLDKINPNSNLDELTTNNHQSSVNLMMTSAGGGNNNSVEQNTYDSINSMTSNLLKKSQNNKELRDLQILRRSLETCCQLLQQQQHQQQQKQQQQQQEEEELINVHNNESPNQMAETIRKYLDDGQLRGYLTSSTCSGVSSLANIGTPNSPPQATSPTGEVKEILDQIRQLQEGVSRYEEDLYSRSTRPGLLQHTVSSPNKFDSQSMELVKMDGLQRVATMPEQTLLKEMAKEINTTTTTSKSSSLAGKTHPSVLLNNRQSNGNNVGDVGAGSSKRPSSLQQQQQQQQQQSQSGRKRFFYLHSTNSNKMSQKGGVYYTPMMMASNSCLPATNNNRCPLKSPIGNVMVVSNFLANRNSRLNRKGWAASRSAPTTPATSLPPTCFSDDSPLLHEHDEDQEDQELPSSAI